MDDVELIEEAGFLVRSPNRVTVLRRLANGPADRTTLQGETDVSRVTLGRILGAFEERDWIRRDDAQYHVTPLGETIVAGLEDFLEAVEAIHRLEDLVEYVPVTEWTVPLRHLHDATLVRPTEAEPAKYLRALIPAANEADHVRGLWSVFDPDILRRYRNRVTDGDTGVTFVFDHEVLETGRSTVPGRHVAEIARSPTGEVYDYEGGLPGTMLIIDDTVFLLLVGEGGYQGVIRSENETVRTWATDLFDRYRTNATDIEPGEFAADNREVA